MTQGKRNPYTENQFRLAEKHLNEISENVRRLNFQPDTHMKTVIKAGNDLKAALQITIAAYLSNTTD